MQRDRRLVANRPVRAILVVVVAPSLHFFPRVGKRQEPVSVHAFRPNAAVEGFGIGVVRGFARTREVERDAPRIGPEVEVAGDELRTLVDADRLRIADDRTRLIERPHDILTPIAEACIQHRREAREGVDHRQHPDLAPCGELVMEEVHGPDIVRADGRLAVIPQLRLDPTLGDLVPQLQA